MASAASAIAPIVSPIIGPVVSTLLGSAFSQEPKIPKSPDPIPPPVPPSVPQAAKSIEPDQAIAQEQERQRSLRRRRGGFKDSLSPLAGNSSGKVKTLLGE